MQSSHACSVVNWRAIVYVPVVAPATAGAVRVSSVFESTRAIT